MDLHCNKFYFSSFLNVTQMNCITAHHQISLSTFKLQSNPQPRQEGSAGQTFSTPSLKMMNGKVRKSSMFTSHWLLSQKESTSDLCLMPWITPKHLSIWHCWWCSFSLSLQHGILRSTKDTEPFHTSVLLTQMVPEMLQAAVTGELHNCKYVNLKTFKLNMPHTCSLGRIWVCNAVRPL